VRSTLASVSSRARSRRFTFVRIGFSDARETVR
jgi:hypothetical protein